MVRPFIYFRNAVGAPWQTRLQILFQDSRIIIKILKAKKDDKQQNMRKNNICSQNNAQRWQIVGKMRIM